MSHLPLNDAVSRVPTCSASDLGLGAGLSDSRLLRLPCVLEDGCVWGAEDAHGGCTAEKRVTHQVQQPPSECICFYLHLDSPSLFRSVFLLLRKILEALC